jgi:hypothetical protein
MEKGLLEYIKKSFSVENKPEWSEEYIGTFFFVKSTQTFITGDKDGWVEIKDLFNL